MISGFPGSLRHGQNGMTERDMLATMEVADRLQEVIIFRSTGPWAKRWLNDEYPSKNFHVKGKSSDWGPHAGLVPYDGTYSKVGFDPGKAAKGTHANIDGLASGFAGKTVLTLKPAQLERQLNVPEGNPPRTACDAKLQVPNSGDLLVTARRSGDQKPMCFRAFRQLSGEYRIHVYPAAGGVSASPLRLLDSDPRGQKCVPLEVMTSNEVGADMPMTGDYDLFAVCPSWASYGSLTSRAIVKPGIELKGIGLRKGLAFQPGVGMDNVMDQGLSTMGKRTPNGPVMDFTARKQAMQANMRSGKTGAMSADSLQNYLGGGGWLEHEDMGNLTPRILRCINELNVQMGATGAKAALRRVHHNAESHRYRLFGALTGQDMVTKKDGEQFGDGFPLTVFQPRTLNVHGYERVCTLESLPEFKDYARALKDAGIYVPKNWIWGV